MVQLCALKTSPRDARQVELALRSSIDGLETETVIPSFEVGLETLNADASASLLAGKDVADVDAILACDLHKAISPLFSASPGLLGEARLWEWMAIGPFRQYFLNRWCGGEVWLTDPVADRPKDATVLRAKLMPQSVKSQARHAIMRLYLYADCAMAFDGSYSKLDLILGMDQDVNTAIFERKLGLSSGLAVLLAEAANTISGPGKRKRRRGFFREVNLMLSTVSPEFLLMDDDGKKELALLLESIATTVGDVEVND